MPDGNRARPMVGAGQLWRDMHGCARVHGVVLVDRIAFAVMRRTRESGGRRRRPFLRPVPALLAGDAGWRLVPSGSEDCGG